MDSVVSWFMLLVLVNVGFVLAVHKGMEEKRQDREENDRFFRERERDYTLNR